MTANRIVPEPDALSGEFFRQLDAGVLCIQRCGACGRADLGRACCSQCGASALSWQPASSAGTIFALTVVHIAYNPFFESRVPYAAGIVQLGEGPCIHAALDRCRPDAVRIGMPVKIVVEMTGNRGFPTVQIPDDQKSGEGRE